MLQLSTHVVNDSFDIPEIFAIFALFVRFSVE